MSKILIVIIIATLLILVGPMALIWSLNTLFPVLAIPYTIETWLAAFLIPAVLKSNVTVNK